MALPEALEGEDVVAGARKGRRAGREPWFLSTLRSNLCLTATRPGWRYGKPRCRRAP